MLGLKIKKYYLLLAVALSLGVGLIHSSALAAATTTGSVLTTSPVSVDLTATPGTTVSTTLQVQNNSSQTITVGVKLDEFNASGTTGEAQITPPPSGDPSVGWVHFSKTSFSAEPGVWVPITMTINVPKTAAFGYYYAVLFSPAIPVASVHSVSDQVRGANAVLVLLDATSSSQNTKLTLKSFTADKFSYQYLPVSFSIDVHNGGNTFTVPHGDIFISRSPNGPTIDALDINGGEGNVLPGTNRIFQVEWDDGFPTYQFKRINGQIVENKQAKPVEQLNWNFSQISKFRYGKYYARLVLVYNQNGRDVPVNAVVSFWVIPWGLMGVSLVLIILIGAGLYMIIRAILKRVKKISAKTKK